MAEPLPYQPRAQTELGAHEALEALLRTLHTSGTLRALDGLFGQLPRLAEAALDPLERPSGRRLASNATLLAAALVELDAERLQRLANGLVRGVNAAGNGASKRAPGPFRLLWTLLNPDTRRGIHAVLVMLQALGRELDGHGASK